MCIIVYKPADKPLPKKETLKQCYDNNPDGAGFMTVKDNKVIISKGYDDFNKFYKTISRISKKRPLVMHFRISTQGGVSKELTHPYPLCQNYDKMRMLQCVTNIGIAHNGIISLTSSAYAKDYNDTMTFIKEYASLIIKGDSIHTDKTAQVLLQKLCKSKLCIMSRGGVTMIGDFIEDDGIFYSNDTYKPYKYTYNGYKNDDAYYEQFRYNGTYYFYPNYWECPNIYNKSKRAKYCRDCLNKDTCESEYKTQ